jgi:phospholipase D-like protein
VEHSVVRRVIAVIVSLGFAAVLLVVPTQAANAAWTPKNGVVFNHPRASHAAEFRHITQIERAIERTPRGATIMFAQYLFNIEETADDLIAANKRGVHVKVIMDDGTNTKQTRALRKALNHDKDPLSWYTTCKRSCSSNVPASTMHAKIYLFSNTAGKNWVSMISSANPHRVNTIASWNNTHTYVGMKKLYDGLAQYFTAMSKDKTVLNYVPKYVSERNVTIFFAPQQEKTIEMLRQLNATTCATGRGFGYKNRTVVRVENWGWTGGRNDVAQRLRTLKSQGCEVQVIINRARISRMVMNTLLTKTRYGKIKVWDAWKDKNKNDSGEMYLHHKAFFISGRISGKDQKSVWTGSQNLTLNGALYNNDLLLRITNSPAMYNAYANNMDHIKKHSKFYTKVPKVLRDTRGDGPQRIKGAGDNATGLTEADLEGITDR